MSVTPEFIGQRYKDTNTGNIWIANSTTPGDWTLEVQDTKAIWEPKSFELLSIPLISGDYGEFTGNITNLEIGVETMLGGFSANECFGLLSVSFPNLLTVDPTFTYASLMQIVNCDDLISFSAPNLTIAGWEISIRSNLLINSIVLTSLVEAVRLTFDTNPALTAFSLPSFVGSAFLGNIVLQNCTNLTSVSLPSIMLPTGRGVSASGCALSAESVNHILARFVANAGYVSGTINLSGGTSAAPSGQGIADKATLIGRGCTVTTN